MALLATLPAVSLSAELTARDVVLAIHGGAAGPQKELSPEEDKLVRADMLRSLEAGQAALKKSGSALDAVEAAIRVLEDSPHFNAGKGSVFTHEGQVEMDASIMDGRNLGAGAVCSVTVIKNPISASRAVMEQTKHVLLSGRGAEVFAAKAGLECVDPSYFWTEKRWKQIQKVWDKEAKNKAEGKAKSSAQHDALKPDSWGTVGAVALDPAGNLAAGTSTGGRSNKMYGRVGDSPIVGAGTYAENGVVAVSGTGEGEYFIKYAAAFDIAALMKYKQMSVADAAADVVLGKLKRAGGEAGIIALDAKGDLAAPHNTPGLFRGWLTRDGQMQVKLYVE